MEAGQMTGWGKDGLNLPRGFLILLVLGFAYALPIMFDGRYYLDDLPHAMNGLTLWEKDGRPLASLLSSLISFCLPNFSGAALFDASPIPQMLGVAALAYAAARLAERLFPAGVGLWQALVVFPVIGSPFMLQNLSYKFDAFTMSLAIALAILAALMAGWRGALLLLAGLMLYQTSVNVFFGAAALGWLADAMNGKADDRGFLQRLGWGLGALVVYSIAMKLLGGFSGDYAAAHSLLVPPDAEGLGAIIRNAGFATYYVTQVVADAPLLALGTLAAFAGLLAKAVRGQGEGQVARLLLSAVIVIASVGGVLLLLQFPAMRPRSLMGFSMLLVFAGYCAHETLATWPNLRGLALGLATGWFFVLANVYANAARDETRFDAFLTQYLMRDMLNAGFKPGGKLAFDGVQPLSPVAQNATRLNTVARILQPNMNGNSEWGFRQLEFFGLPSAPIMDATDDSLKALCADGPATTAPWYQVFTHGDTMVVSFPKGVCFRG